jgi:hypothetical protein
LVIPALPGGQAADNQPDDKKQRSEAHEDLRNPRLPGLALVRHLGKKSVPGRGNAGAVADGVGGFSRNLEASQASGDFTAGGPRASVG